MEPSPRDWIIRSADCYLEVRSTTEQLSTYDYSSSLSSSTSCRADISHRFNNEQMRVHLWFLMKFFDTFRSMVTETWFDCDEGHSRLSTETRLTNNIEVWHTREVCESLDQTVSVLLHSAPEGSYPWTLYVIVDGCQQFCRTCLIHLVYQQTYRGRQSFPARSGWRPW